MVFYRKYRPQKFADLVGQEAIAKTLLSQLESGKIGHGYLFYGSKGTGKTSTARIFAKAVNCQRPGTRDQGPVVSKSKSSNQALSSNKLKAKYGEPCGKCDSCLAIADGSHLDLIEIDAASNRGIDEIRDLREKIKLSPVSSRFKVYIIDEVHMLTTEAFNALLKTLEEPPAHAIFILCTTEVSRLPQTIVSRLQRFNFQRANDAAIAKVIGKIAKAEGVDIENEAISAIAKVSEGSFRDAVSVLDQLSASGAKITTADVFAISKTSGFDRLFSFAAILADRDLKAAVMLIDEVSAGGDVSSFTGDFVNFLKKLLFINIGISAEALDIEADQFLKMKSLAAGLGFGNLNSLMKLFVVAEGEIKLYPSGEIPLILAVCKYIGEQGIVSNSGVEDARGPVGSSSHPTSSSGTLSNVKLSRASGLRALDGTPSAPATPRTKLSDSKESNVSLEEIEKHWSEFLLSVKDKNAHVFALLRSTRPDRVEGDNLVLTVFFRFHKEKLEEIKISDMLADTLSDLLGKQVRMKFTLAERQVKLPKVVAASDVTDISGDDLTQIAAEIFSK